MSLQLLIDCEGIDAFDQTMDYSTQIFSLGVLLSSLLVFNQVWKYHSVRCGSIIQSGVEVLHQMPAIPL